MSKIVLFPVVQRLAQWSPVAVLIPEDISATAVPHGERKFHSFLKILFEARPDVSGESSGNHPEGLLLPRPTWQFWRRSTTGSSPVIPADCIPSIDYPFPKS